MALTKSEKLIEKEGELVECDVCGRRSVFNRFTWRMDDKRNAVCPACQPTVAKSGSVLVSI